MYDTVATVVLRADEAPHIVESSWSGSERKGPISVGLPLFRISNQGAPECKPPFRVFFLYHDDDAPERLYFAMAD